MTATTPVQPPLDLNIIRRTRREIFDAFGMTPTEPGAIPPEPPDIDPPATDPRRARAERLARKQAEALRVRIHANESERGRE